MRNFIHISIIAILLVIIVSAVGCDTDPDSEPQVPGAVEHGCEWAENLPESRPPDFNLLFKYGHSITKNELNTFNGTYTKNLGVDPPVTIYFSLTDEEMEKIYQTMVEIDFFCYPDEFVIPVPESGIVSSFDPYLGYYFMVECGNDVKVLRWEDNRSGKDEDADNLRWLIKRIINIIESREEYWDLPPRSGLYL